MAGNEPSKTPAGDDVPPPGAPREAEEPLRRFGAFGGVFTPVTLTILGVIMFMRTGYVTGWAGLWMGLAILAISKLITVLTTLSLSAVATNQRMKVGGVYYMISRVLGPDFGGSIGITLFVAQTVGVSFYVIGFTEAFFSVLEPWMASTSAGGSSLADLAEAWRAPQVFSTLVVSGLFAITFKGADVAIKAQYVVLGLLLLSVAAFVVGGSLEYDPARLETNMGAAFEGDVDFWLVFAIFFPAATGITAGANMSGDLRKPGRDIPRGTLAAIGFTAAVYVVQMLLMAGSVDRSLLQEDPFGALQQMSVFAPLIVLGVFAATLSSAIGSFLGAPRILQAMGQDRIMRLMEFFGKGSGPANEPRRATVLTFAIAVAVIWAGDLNAVAPVFSMFFLIAYGMINLSAFVESKGGNPSFRPRFRPFHWVTALAGAVGCVVAMVKIDETTALVAIGITALVYFYLRNRDIKTTFGDAKRGYIFQSTRDNLLYLEESSPHPKNWRPLLAVISDDPASHPHLVSVGSWIESERGLLTVAHIMETPEVGWARRAHMARQRVEEIRQQLLRADIVAFPEAMAVRDFHEGLAAFIRSYSIGGLRPNSILVALPDGRDAAARERFFVTMDVLTAHNRNVLVLKPGWIDPEKKKRTIDIWWRGERNGSLMAILAYLVTLNPAWTGSSIRLFRIVADEAARDEAFEHLSMLSSHARIETEVKVVIDRERSATEVIRERSGEAADLVLMGMNADKMGAFRAFVEKSEEALSGLPTTVFVWSNGEADVSA
jgi:amino acid transporter